MKFNYKNDRLYKIVSFIVFILFILCLIVILKNTSTILSKIIIILVIFIMSYLILTLLDKTICISKGRFNFDKHSFIYETLRNEYTINYQEIEYITKSTYTDTNGLLTYQNYIYEIKVKNAGKFVFKYKNDSLDEAINELAFKAKIKIDE